MPPKRKAQIAKDNGTVKKPRGTKKAVISKAKNSSRLDQSLFSLKVCQEWFNQYKDAEREDDIITPVGSQEFFKDLCIGLESVDLILICYKLNVDRMGFITRSEWDQGMKQLGADTVEKLKAVLPQLRKSVENDEEFKKMYNYAYSFAKTGGQKSMDVEIAMSLWQVLLDSKYPHIQSFCDFLQKEKPVKVINKDQWSSLFDFYKTVPEDFGDYDSSAAWPVLFDNYVEWKKMELDER